MFILFRKHFFLFKEESEVLWAGKNAEASHAGFWGGGRGLAAKAAQSRPLSAVPGLR